MKNRTSNLRIPRSDALPLSHRYFKASAVYYEVHMTHVLHTARISNVDNVMFVNRIRSLIPHRNSDFFLCPTLVTRRITPFFTGLMLLPEKNERILVLEPKTNWSKVFSVTNVTKKISTNSYHLS